MIKCHSKSENVQPTRARFVKSRVVMCGSVISVLSTSASYVGMLKWFIKRPARVRFMKRLAQISPRRFTTSCVHPQMSKSAINYTMPTHQQLGSVWQLRGNMLLPR